MAEKEKVSIPLPSQPFRAATMAGGVFLSGKMILGLFDLMKAQREKEIAWNFGANNVEMRQLALAENDQLFDLAYYFVGLLVVLWALTGPLKKKPV